MSYPRHSDAAFETVIEAQLLANGYLSVDRDSFDRQPAVLPETVTEPTIILLKERRAALIAAASDGQNYHTREYGREFAWGR